MRRQRTPDLATHGLDKWRHGTPGHGRPACRARTTSSSFGPRRTTGLRRELARSTVTSDPAPCRTEPPPTAGPTRLTVDRDLARRWPKGLSPWRASRPLRRHPHALEPWPIAATTIPSVLPPLAEVASGPCFGPRSYAAGPAGLLRVLLSQCVVTGVSGVVADGVTVSRGRTRYAAQHAGARVRAGRDRPARPVQCTNVFDEAVEYSPTAKQLVVLGHDTPLRLLEVAPLGIGLATIEQLEGISRVAAGTLRTPHATSHCLD
jgi:hypothetical protein